MFGADKPGYNPVHHIFNSHASLLDAPAPDPAATLENSPPPSGTRQQGYPVGSEGANLRSCAFGRPRCSTRNREIRRIASDGAAERHYIPAFPFGATHVPI